MYDAILERLRMFNFNFKKFDYLEVYESIKRFYPLGIKKEEGGLYYSYQGIKELEEIIIDNIHKDEHYEERWLAFTKEIEKETNREILGTTYGRGPSFSSYVLLDKKTLDNLERTKKLHFFVSLIGPYYTVIGDDANMVNLDDKLYSSTNYLVVSPEGEFSDTFELLCNQIESRFKGYRFVPFLILNQTIYGLDVSYSDHHLNSIFNALFNNLIDLNTLKVIGNKLYRSEAWIKAGFVDEGEGWVAYPS